MDNFDVLNLTEVIPPSKCERKCEGCPICSAPALRQEPAAVSSGQLYIGGLFPLRYSQKRLSHENVIASEAFIWAVDTFNQRHTSHLNGINLGAFSLDSPGNDPGSESVINALENCEVTPMTNSKSPKINRHDVIAYMKLIPEEDFTLQHMSHSDKTVLSLTKVGIRQNGLLAGNILSSRLANLLRSLQWTYPTIVWSEKVTDQAFKHTFENGLRENGICLADRHILTQTDTQLSDLSQVLLGNSDRSSAVILMTDLSSTIDFLKSFVDDAINGSALHFVLFPWNADALLQVPTKIGLGSVIFELQTTKNANFQNFLKKMPASGSQRYTWLKELKKDVCPRDCGSRADVNECWADWIEESANLSSYVIDVTDDLLTMIGNTFHDRCQNQLDNCDIAHIFRSTLREGDISLPLDIVNVQMGAEGDMVFTKVRFCKLTLWKNNY